MKRTLINYLGLLGMVSLLSYTYGGSDIFPTGLS